MEDLKPLIGARFVRTSEPDQDEALMKRMTEAEPSDIGEVHLDAQVFPLWIPCSNLREPLDPKAIREAAKEAGEQWKPRTLQRRLNLWWDFLFIAETDAARQTARTAINALSMALGRRMQRDSHVDPQPARQVIELQITVSPGDIRGGSH